MNRKELNYAIFCYFNNRRLKNGGRTIISIKTLEQYCEVPLYTIQHLVSLRRLISEKFVYKVADSLENQFGFDRNKSLTTSENEEKQIYDLFND